MYYYVICSGTEQFDFREVAEEVAEKYERLWLMGFCPCPDVIAIREDVRADLPEKGNYTVLIRRGYVLGDAGDMVSCSDLEEMKGAIFCALHEGYNAADIAVLTQEGNYVPLALAMRGEYRPCETPDWVECWGWSV